MAPLVHGFDPPERFVAGTVGEPGQRTFFLQARSGARVVSVALEKQQVAALAERIDELLDEVMASQADSGTVVPAVAPLDLEDSEPLEQPIEEEFRAGTMTLSWDPDDARVVIEVFPFTEAAVVSPEQVDDDFEEPEPDELLLVRLTAGAGPGLRRARRASCSRPGGRAARSAATRSTPTATCACGPTGSAAATREPPGAPRRRARRGRAGRARPDHAGLQRHLRRRDRRDAGCVYKPIAGERPLWDFPDGTLAVREVAAYVVSEATGWDVVPPTVPARRAARARHGAGLAGARRGAGGGRHRRRGRGAGRAGAHVFDGVDGLDQPVSLVHEDSRALRRMAVFDAIVNNADRKGGHVLGDGRTAARYGVDHGVTFHVEHKLRTVLWGWAGEPLDDEELAVRRPAATTPSAAALRASSSSAC